ncbi:MAG: hypothetical protein AAF092_10525 [Pseudomonadota bacterium]
MPWVWVGRGALALGGAALGFTGAKGVKETGEALDSATRLTYALAGAGMVYLAIKLTK